MSKLTDDFNTIEEQENIEDLPVLEAEEKIEKEETKLGLKRAKFKRVLRKIFSIRDDMASHESIREKMIDNAKVTGVNALILFCAIIIASIGLNLDSVAVIIGAMLVSPLMGTIMGFSYGVVAADKKVMKRSSVGFLVQVLISLTVSTLYFLITPNKEPTNSLLARTSPTYYDVIIAFAGGIAGVLAQTRKSEYSNVIPGVAIATALMPPLCTCGWAIATLRWEHLLGALYLFIINGYFIFLATVIMLAVMAVPKVDNLSLRQWKKIRLRITLTTIFTLLPFIILTVIKILQAMNVLPPSDFPNKEVTELSFIYIKKLS